MINKIPKTAVDVFRMLPEGTLCEAIDNVLYMSPSRKYVHQKMVVLLAITISDFLEKTNVAKLVISPFDVYFEDLLSAVQPDILVITNENLHLLKEDGLHGAPDVIIEVLSADKKRDTVKKKSLYERAGVKEYFIVDPFSREITCWLLQDNVYQLQYTRIGNFKSSVLSLEFEF